MAPNADDHHTPGMQREVAPLHVHHPDDEAWNDRRLIPGRVIASAEAAAPR
jgi:hypothetical protein